MQTRTLTLRLIALAVCVALASPALNCGEPPPVEEIALTSITHYFDGPEGLGEIKTGLIGSIEGAEERIDIAVARLTDGAIADALIAAADRGVEVRVVTDEFARGDAGIAALEEAEDVTVVYGDGVLKYLPEPTLTSLLESCLTLTNYIECTQRESGGSDPDDGLMVRPDEYNVMSNNFMVVDELEVWSISTPIDGTQSYWLGWQARSQDLAIAFSREFQQMAGGVFATTLDIYNGPVKSTVHGIVYDSRINGHRPGRKVDLQPGYLTDEGIMRVEFNPQQRLVKELLDELYRARASVYLMTDELDHKYAIKALVYKVEAGFDVRVIVREGSRLPRELVELGVVRVADASYGYLPTAMILDEAEDRNGDQWARTGLVLTHQLYRSAPFEVFTPQQLNDPNEDDNVVRIQRSDLFVDGTLWTMREFLGTPREGSQLTRLVGLFDEAWSDATPAN